MADITYSFRKIGLAADHAGRDLKQMILEFVRQSGLEVVDYGVAGDAAKVDYPDYASLLADDVSKAKLDGGIAICGTGIGMAMVANKFRNVRAACVWDEYSCRMSRAHNDSNLLCVGSRTLNHHRVAELVKIWLTTPFTGEQHEIRLEKIASIEKLNFKSPA